VRQKLFSLEAAGTQLDAWSIGIGSVRDGLSFRKGTVTWKKNYQKWAIKKLIF
jgi:hypothetical protein